MTPIRVAIGLMIIAGLFGFLVGKGAPAPILLTLPLIATGFIYANKSP
jgi:hypothetical protein